MYSDKGLRYNTALFGSACRSNSHGFKQWNVKDKKSYPDLDSKNSNNIKNNQVCADTTASNGLPIKNP